MTLYSRLRCKTKTFLVTAHSILFPLIISPVATIRQPRQNIHLVTEAFYDSLSSDKSHNSCITFPYQEQCYINCNYFHSHANFTFLPSSIFSMHFLCWLGVIRCVRTTSVFNRLVRIMGGLTVLFFSLGGLDYTDTSQNEAMSN